MELMMLAMLTATLVMRYGVIDLVSSVRGTTSPPAEARRRRMELAHEREMAKIAHRTGPTVGEAVAARVSARVGQPKAPKVRTGRGAFRSCLSGLWGDSWEHANESRVRHHERKLVGDLPRQRAARAVRDAARRRVEAALAARRAVNEPVADYEVPPETVDPDGYAELPTSRQAAAAFGEEIQWYARGAPSDSTCPVCGQSGMDHPECVALTYGDDAAPTGPPPGESAMPEPPSTAPAIAITHGGTMHATGETLDPQAGLDFTRSVQSAMAEWVARIEQSVANLTQKGVSGGPIDALNGISDALASVVGKADEGVGYFESHLQIQDVAQADETVGGEEYIGIGAARNN